MMRTVIHAAVIHAAVIHAAVIHAAVIRATLYIRMNHDPPQVGQAVRLDPFQHYKLKLSILQIVIRHRRRS
jgi:hypothetical protein